MAKLNVEVLDMTSGEITKIAYEGAEYVKVEGEAKVGDIAVHKEGKHGGYVVTTGSYYEVVGLDRAGDIYIIEDNGSRGAHWRSYFNIFRKISESKPTLEQRVESLESDVAAMKGEKVVKEPKRLTVGDKAKIIGNESSHYVEIGDIIEITVDDHSHMPYQGKRDSDGENSGWLYEEDLEACVEETIEFEGATYRKVDREAREGDVVIFKHGIHNVPWITKGKPYKTFVNYRSNDVKVKGDDGDGIRVYESDYRNRTRETVDVYEPIEQAQYVPQEGDIVVITANTSLHANEIGDIGKVGKEKPLDDGGVKVYVPGGPTRGIRTKPCDIRKATSAEVEQYEQAVKDANKPKLKAGDYVKFKRGIHDTKADKPYLIEYYASIGGLAFKDDAGDWCSNARTGEYEIISAEEAKWSKIGRRIGELRKGDIVRITDTCGADLTNGELIEVISGSVEMSAHVRGDWAVCSKLVAPVESLFNA